MGNVIEQLLVKQQRLRQRLPQWLPRFQKRSENFSMVDDLELQTYQYLLVL